MGLLLIGLAMFAEFQYENTTPHLDLTRQLGVVPATLAGFNFADDPEIAQGDVPRFRVGRPVQLQTHWTIENVFPPGIRCFVMIQGSGRTLNFEAPLIGTGERIGETQRVNVLVEVPRFSINGDATITMGLRWADMEKNVFESVSYRAPCYVSAIITTSSFESVRVNEIFGADAHRLMTSFRLGKNGRIRIPQDRFSPTPTRQIGIVSALRNDRDYDEGEIVAELEIIGEGKTVNLPIRAGQHTSIANYDMYPPRSLAIPKIDIASQRPEQGDAKTWDGQPLQRNAYHTTLTLNAPIVIDEILVRSTLEKGAIDIYEIVLIQAK